MTSNTSSLSDGVAWFDALLAGQLIFAICSIAIASLGLAMFGGRLKLQRGVTAILACFIVLGASTIAKGLVDRPPLSAALVERPLVPPLPEMQRQNDRKVDDPYARASLAR